MQNNLKQSEKTYNEQETEKLLPFFLLMFENVIVLKNLKRPTMSKDTTWSNLKIPETIYNKKETTYNEP